MDWLFVCISDLFKGKLFCLLMELTGVTGKYRELSILSYCSTMLQVYYPTGVVNSCMNSLHLHLSVYAVHIKLEVWWPAG